MEEEEQQHHWKMMATLCAFYKIPLSDLVKKHGCNYCGARFTGVFKCQNCDAYWCSHEHSELDYLKTHHRGCQLRADLFHGKMSSARRNDYLRKYGQMLPPIPSDAEIAIISDIEHRVIRAADEPYTETPTLTIGNNGSNDSGTTCAYNYTVMYFLPGLGWLMKFSTTTTATAEVLLDKETTPIKLDRPPSVTPDEVQELLTDAKSTVDSAHTIARYLWNDFDLLVPEARAVEAKVKNDKAASAEAAVEANVFIRLFVQQEKQWIAADATSIVTRSNLSKPPNFNYSHIVLHTDRFVVAIASDTPPSNDPISKKEAVLDDIQESGETTRWPTPPEQAILTAWQVTGHEHNQVASVVRGQAPVFGPHLEQPFTFGTFLGLAGDVASQPPAEGDTRSIDERCKAASDKIFALLNKMAQLRAECMPPMKKGQLLVGEAASRSQLIWNSAPSPTKLAFHALCAVANEKGSEHLMASYADHTLAFWDLTRPHLGPVVSAHLSGTRRRAVAMAVTSKFVVILDSGLKLTIVAYNSVALRVAASDRDNSAALLARIWNNAEDPLMLQLDMPLGFSLAANPSSPELFYLGTSHGYVFEMAVHTSAESMMALFHTRTFYTYTPDVVVAVSARNGRVLAQLSNEQLVLFHTTPSETESTESKHLCYVIDGTDKIQFRSATFAGSLIFAELTNRHLAVIDYLNPATNQRIIPTSLGATTSSDALRREFLESLMHVNSPEGYVRLAYGNMDIFTLQLPEFSEEIQQKILNPDTIM